MSLQPNEVLIIVLVALIVLGPTRLPGAIRSIGRAFRQVREFSTTVRQEMDAAISPPTVEPAAPPARPADPADTGHADDADAERASAAAASTGASRDVHAEPSAEDAGSRPQADGEQASKRPGAADPAGGGVTGDGAA